MASSYHFVRDVITQLNFGLGSMRTYTVRPKTFAPVAFMPFICSLQLSGCITPLWTVLQINDRDCFTAILDLQIFCIYALQYLDLSFTSFTL